MKNPSFWILLGAFVGAIGAYIASEQQNIENKRNQDKLDSAKTEIINIQDQLNKSTMSLNNRTEELLQRDEVIISLQKELQIGSDANAKFVKSNSLQLPTEVGINVNIIFDVVKNNLESFEELVLQSVSKEDIHRAKTDEHMPTIQVPIHVMTSSENPFLYFTNMLIRIEFYNSDLSEKQQVRSQSVYQIAQYIKSELLTNLNMSLFFKHHQSIPNSSNALEPILLLFYNINKRKFILSHLGSTKLAATVTNIDKMSLYDLVNTNMVVQILPSLIYINGVTGIANDQLKKENHYEIELLSMGFPISQWAIFRNFNQRSTDWPIPKSQQHIHKVTYGDLKLNSLN